MDNELQTPQSPVEGEPQPRLQKRTGLVTSAAGDKTIRVLVEHLVRHPQYGKYLLRRSKLAAFTTPEINGAARAKPLKVNVLPPPISAVKE